MKKIVLGVFSIALLSSCTVSRSITVTGQPIGTKKGVAKASVFSKDADFSLSKAAKNGNIETIGAAETTSKIFLFFTTFKTTVYGE